MSEETEPTEEEAGSPKQSDPPIDAPEGTARDSEADDLATASDVHVIVPSREETVPPLALAAAVTLLVGAAFHFGLDPKAPSMALFGAIGFIYFVFSLVALGRMRRLRDLDLLKLHGGDVTLAVFVGGLIYGLSWAGSSLLMARGSSHEVWLARVYLILGDTLGPKRYVVGLALFVIGALEELTWRGLVVPSLETKTTPMRAGLIAASLWALSHLPTAYRLADPQVGPNPLLVVAAFGCGVVWAYFRVRVQRLLPVILSHAFFSWAIAEFPLWHL